MVSSLLDSDPFIGVGDELKAARIGQSLSLNDVSSQLRISVKNLECLEAGKREQLPGPTYVLGFVRSYAKLLSLDADAMCKRLTAGMTEKDRQPEYHFVENKIKSGGEWRNMIMIGAVLVIVAYTAWYFLWNDYIPDDEILSGQDLAEETISVEQVSATNPQVSEDSTEVALQTDTSIADDDSNKGQEVNPSDTAPIKQALAPSNQSETSDTSSVTKAYAAQATPEDSSSVKKDGFAIKALADTWVNLVSPSGENVFAKLMREGEIIALPSDSNYMLSIANAGTISLGYKNQDTPWMALGEAGQVIEKKPIDTLLLNN